MESFSEWLIVPVMNWILQSLLPMMLVEKTTFSSLSAANGQFMMFETASYRKYQWHQQVKNQHVEDIRLARMVKSKGLKMAVLLGNYDIYCRMYRHLDEAVLGFSRNIHEYFGGSRAVMTGFWLLVSAGPFVVWAALGWQYFLFFVALVMLNRSFVALAARQNILWSVFLHPFHMLSFAVIVFYNILRRIQKETTWKGRKINLQA
jgi:chlorobactene glucosyltransferase